MTSIAATVFAVLEEELVRVPRSTQTLDELGADSLDRVVIAMALERVLDLDISDEVIASWTTVQSVIDSLAVLAGVTGSLADPR